MKDDGADCDGMMCVVHCAKKLKCLGPSLMPALHSVPNRVSAGSVYQSRGLDATVESRCLTVKNSNPKRDPQIRQSPSADPRFSPRPDLVWL